MNKIIGSRHSLDGFCSCHQSYHRPNGLQSSESSRQVPQRPASCEQAAVSCIPSYIPFSNGAAIPWRALQPG
ncbi:hypothetical protein DERP_005866 [Dermatophagoides pteronyssinus]|uniref:Uncharacterized protein n=1 Tax=Dermatophagoides pteronyssinus TaxID=6956 RepID=A0ABQ8J9R9_DERPT|nr:hypothetical protein DERP_005866 [Dermatophagoides pteronyssinus]